MNTKTTGLLWAVAFAMLISGCSPGNGSPPSRDSIEDADQKGAVSVPVVQMEQAPAPQPGDVQFAQVNPVLQAIVDSIRAEEDFYSDANVQFDTEYSNLRIGQLKYDLSLTTRSNAWAPGTAVHIESSTRYRVLPSTSVHKRSIEGGTSITMLTDVVAMLRYAGLKALEKAPKPSGSDADFQRRYIELITRLSKLKDMVELAPLLRDSRQLGREVIQVASNNERERAACFRSGKCKASPNPGETQEQAQERTAAYHDKKVTEIGWLLNELNRLRINLEGSRDDLGFSKVIVSHPGFETLPPGMSADAASIARMLETRLEFMAPAMRVANHTIVDLKPKEYEKLKAEMDQHFANLEVKDPETVKKTEKQYRDALIAIKKAIMNSKEN